MFETRLELISLSLPLEICAILSNCSFCKFQAAIDYDSLLQFTRGKSRSIYMEQIESIYIHCIAQMYMARRWFTKRARLFQKKTNEKKTIEKTQKCTFLRRSQIRVNFNAKTSVCMRDGKKELLLMSDNFWRMAEWNAPTMTVKQRFAFDP